MTRINSFTLPNNVLVELWDGRATHGAFPFTIKTWQGKEPLATIASWRDAQLLNERSYKHEKTACKAFDKLRGAFPFTEEQIEQSNPEPPPSVLKALINDLWCFIENVTDETPDRTERFFALRERVREPKAEVDGPNDQKYRDAAREYHDEGELEFDDVPVVSESDEGAYVQCWKWVSNGEAGISGE